MAQPDLAVITSSLSNLAVQIPLIQNHPTVQALDRSQNFQQEVRDQFQEVRDQFQEVRGQLDQGQKFQQEVRGQFQEVRGQFAQHDERLIQLDRSLNEMKQEIRHGFDQLAREIRHIRDQLSRDQELLPLRLHNSSCGTKAPLRYPPGTQASEITRDNLLAFTVVECQQLAAALKLPALVPVVTVMDRRQQIAIYLGVSI